VLAACGVAVALSWPRPLALVVAGAAAVSLAVTSIDMVRLHPYQYVFFNRLIAGGLKEASTSYETDYWGASGREGALWIEANYDRRDDGAPIRVTSCLYRASTEYFLPADRFKHVGPSQDPDLFVSYTRWRCHERMEGKVVHIVEREGVPLLYVKQVSDEVRSRAEVAGQ
jgi:hypothetical protein